MLNNTFLQYIHIFVFFASSVKVVKKVYDLEGGAGGKFQDLERVFKTLGMGRFLFFFSFLFSWVGIGWGEVPHYIPRIGKKSHS